MTATNAHANDYGGCVEALVGEWEIVYRDEGADAPAPPRERLVLRRDGTYTWEPTPHWALPIGRWGVRREPDLGNAPVLSLESRGGAPRWHFVIPVKPPNVPLYWVWQRKVAVVVDADGRKEIAHDVVLFEERVLLAQRPS